MTMTRLSVLNEDQLVNEFVSAAQEYDRQLADSVAANKAHRRATAVHLELLGRGSEESLMPLLKHEALVVRGIAAVHIAPNFPHLARPILVDASRQPGLLGLTFKAASHHFGFIKEL